MAEFELPEEDSRPAREGLPPTYRMRADRHYVDFLASRTPAGRERSLQTSALGTPTITDSVSLAPLIASVKEHGILQPLLVNERGGSLRVIAGRRRLAAAIAAGLRTVPCLVHDVDDETAERLRDAAKLAAATPVPPLPAAQSDAGDVAGETLSRSIGTARSLADLLGGEMSDLSRPVVAALLRAELARAASLVEGVRIARGTLPVARGPVPVARLVDTVINGFAAERRMRHVEFAPHLDVPPGHTIVADERLLAAALNGAVQATLALLDALPSSRVSLIAGLTASKQVTLVAAQDHVLPPAVWVERAFDPTWTDRPGGPAVVVGMAALERAARSLGGEATAALSARGSRVAITIPAGI